MLGPLFSLSLSPCGLLKFHADLYMTSPHHGRLYRLRGLRQQGLVLGLRIVGRIEVHRPFSYQGPSIRAASSRHLPLSRGKVNQHQSSRLLLTVQWSQLIMWLQPAPVGQKLRLPLSERRGKQVPEHTDTYKRWFQMYYLMQYYTLTCIIDINMYNI